jgi:hypothetical protein
MRTTTLAIALLVLTTGLAIVTPGASAWGSCNGIEQPGCPGLVCIWNPSVPGACNIVYVPYP